MIISGIISGCVKKSDVLHVLHINGISYVDSHRLDDTIYRYRQGVDRYKVYHQP